MQKLSFDQKLQMQTQIFGKKKKKEKKKKREMPTEYNSCVTKVLRSFSNISRAVSGKNSVKKPPIIADTHDYLSIYLSIQTQ